MSCYALYKEKTVQKEKVKMLEEQRERVVVLERMNRAEIMERTKRAERLKRAECIDGIIKRILGVATVETSLFQVKEGQETKSKEQLDMEILVAMFKTVVTSQLKQPEETLTLNEEQDELEKELSELMQQLQTLRLNRSRLPRQKPA